MKRLLLVISVAILSGCVSTQMREFVGQPIEEAMFAYGQPERVIELADGRRAYQFRYGGGARVIPGHSTSQGSVNYAGVATVNTSSTPAMIFEDAGCLLTFITSDSDGDGHHVVEEFRVPRDLVC